MPLENSVNSVDTLRGNTEPSLEGNLLEGVETTKGPSEQQLAVSSRSCDSNIASSMRGYLMGRRYSPNPAVMLGARQKCPSLVTNGSLGNTGLYGPIAWKQVINNPVNSVNPTATGSCYGNTEPRSNGNIGTGVTTEAANPSWAKQSLATSNGNERARDSLSGRRDSLNSSESYETVAEMSTAAVRRSNKMREGFARRTLLIKPLGKGETGRLRVRRKDVVGFVVIDTPNIIQQVVRQMYIYPPEFYVTAMIVIENKEIEQASGDLLDDKQFNYALSA